MKIPDSNLNAVTTPAQTERASAATEAPSAQGASGRTDSRSDRVQLSTLSSALQSLAGGSPAQEAQIESLGAAYRSGQYSVDTSLLSKSLVSDALGSR